MVHPEETYQNVRRHIHIFKHNIKRSARRESERGGKVNVRRHGRSYPNHWRHGFFRSELHMEQGPHVQVTMRTPRFSSKATSRLKPSSPPRACNEALRGWLRRGPSTSHRDPANISASSSCLPLFLLDSTTAYGGHRHPRGIITVLLWLTWLTHTVYETNGAVINQ